jgi:hypothetical protein
MKWPRPALACHVATPRARMPRGHAPRSHEVARPALACHVATPRARMPRGSVRDLNIEVDAVRWQSHPVMPEACVSSFGGGSGGGGGGGGGRGHKSNACCTSLDPAETPFRRAPARAR